MLAFAEARLRNGMVVVDGYSSAKTVKSALADMGRYIAKYYNEAEGKALIGLKKKEAEELLLFPNVPEAWYAEVEEVSCATKYDEETDTTEYKEGYNYYVMVRFVA